MKSEPSAAGASRSPSRQAQTLADQATEHHRRGDLAAAERFYREALAIDPVLPDGLHGMGLLALGRDMPAQAIALIGRAVSLRPAQALYLLNLGHALRARGHLEEARAALNASVLHDSGDARAHAALALVLEQLERTDEAAESARTALLRASAPDQVPGMNALVGRVAIARAAWSVAIAALRNAVAENASDAPSWHNLALAHAAIGQSEDAERCFRQVATLLPNDPAAQANLGSRLFENNRFEEALSALRRSVSLQPPTPETGSNLGLVLMALGSLEEAEQVLAEAAVVAPDRPGITVNHGTALLELGRFDAAERAFARVKHEAVGTLDAERARFNRATLMLAQGRFREGWAAFEARHAVLGHRYSDLPNWNGEALPHGRRLLIEAEQGLGDIIQFLRYVEPAMQRAAVVLALPAPLLRLAQAALPAACQVVDSAEAIPPADLRADLLSLPMLLGEDVPRWTGPYLNVAATVSGNAIGLCWSGSPGYRFDRRRSLELRQLAPLAAPGRRFIALQPDRATEAAPPGLVLDRPTLVDLADTAAIIASTRLVITVDTAVAHLAGALGRPVWLLNRFGGDWRWRPGNRDADGTSLWYPSLRFFEQAIPEPRETAWAEVIEQVADALDLETA